MVMYDIIIGGKLGKGYMEIVPFLQLLWSIKLFQNQSY